MRRANRSRVTAVLSLAVATGLTGCSGSSSAGKDPRPRPSPVSSTASTTATTDATAQAEADVLRAYNGYWAAQIAAQAHPTKRLPKELGYYSIAKAQADIQATVLLFREQGIRLRGEPQLEPVVSGILLGANPSAAITDCVDSSHWKPVYAATGKSALAPGQKPRVLMESTAVKYAGRWVIRTSVAHRDRTC